MTCVYGFEHIFFNSPRQVDKEALILLDQSIKCNRSPSYTLGRNFIGSPTKNMKILLVTITAGKGDNPTHTHIKSGVFDQWLQLESGEHCTTSP